MACLRDPTRNFKTESTETVICNLSSHRILIWDTRWLLRYAPRFHGKKSKKNSPIKFPKKIPKKNSKKIPKKKFQKKYQIFFPKKKKKLV
jgi:hypothetical protein